MRGYVEMLEREHYNEPPPDSELPDDLCPKCGGRGGYIRSTTRTTWSTGPDRDGQYDPCDPCEGTGLVDFERDRPHAIGAKWESPA